MTSSHDDRDGGIQFIALFTGSRHRNDKFAVFLRDKILGRIGRTAVLIFFLNHNYKLLRRFKVEANFSAIGGILRRRRLFYVVRSQIHQLDFGNFVARSTRLHHFVKANNHRVGAGRIKDRLQCGAIIGLKGGFVFRDERFLLFRAGGTYEKPGNDQKRYD